MHPEVEIVHARLVVLVYLRVCAHQQTYSSAELLINWYPFLLRATTTFGRISNPRAAPQNITNPPTPGHATNPASRVRNLRRHRRLCVILRCSSPEAVPARTSCTAQCYKSSVAETSYPASGSVGCLGTGRFETFCGAACPRPAPDHFWEFLRPR